MLFLFILIFTFAKLHFFLMKFWENKILKTEIVRLIFVCTPSSKTTFLFVVFGYFKFYLGKITLFPRSILTKSAIFHENATRIVGLYAGKNKPIPIKLCILPGDQARYALSCNRIKLFAVRWFMLAKNDPFRFRVAEDKNTHLLNIFNVSHTGTIFVYIASDSSKSKLHANWFQNSTLLRYILSPFR